MEKSSVGIKVKVQQFGSFLSRMVMPNIMAFIAWGLITALFIPTGWFPSEKFVVMVGPMLRYVLPVLIAYTGGHIVYGVRGAVVGVIGTIGVIEGSSVPMLLGGMVMGPLGAWLTKKMDQAFEGKIKEGFEMLVNNFSAGILGTIIAMVALTFIGPFISAVTNALAAGVDVLVRLKLLPLVHIFVEPAKVLFLNNAINHGVFGPIAMEQSAKVGKSILFMIESNPGPGLGVLIAYMLFGKGSEKSSAFGASIIHFIGGIHEIYFPYVLMNPLLIAAPILGGMSGTFVFSMFKAGLTASPSPGSIIAYLLMTPKGGYFGVLLGVLISTIVSFLVASAILKLSKQPTKNLDEAKSEMLANKAKKDTNTISGSKKLKDVKSIVFACDAGMGSSAMGASILKKKVNAAGLNIAVTNKAIANLTEDADLIVTHKDLTDRAKTTIPGAIHVSVENFMNTPKYDELVAELIDSRSVTEQAPSTVVEKNVRSVSKNQDILKKENILLNQSFANREEAIRKVADIMISNGYTTEEYYQGMMTREQEAPTSFGIGMSIPHGTFSTKSAILKSGLVVLVAPDGVKWNDENVKLIIGIAGVGDEHLQLLANIAGKIDDEEKVDVIVREYNVDGIYELLTTED